METWRGSEICWEWILRWRRSGRTAAPLTDGRCCTSRRPSRIRETVVTLLDAGADVRQVSQTPMRNEALHAVLALSKDGDVTRLLIERGADVNAVQTAGYRPLHQAAVAGREDLVRMLLNAGAEKTASCDRGKTPAEYARERGHAAVAELLS